MEEALGILVVEDYDILRDAMVSLLVRHGHKAVGVAMAEDVDDEPLDFLPSLYIIDLNLPGEDGFSLTRRIRQSNPQAGIILATARTELHERVAGYSHGADVYLTKPVAPEELLAVIASLKQRLNRLAKESTSTLVVSPQRMMVRGPVATVSLTQAEIVLLGAFSRAAGNMLEHWQVAQQLGGGSDVSKDNMEVRLGRLRKKLIGCGVEGATIKAIRGRGYKLCCSVTVQDN